MSEVLRNRENGEHQKVDQEKLEKLSKENFERMEREAAKAEQESKNSIEAIQDRIEKTAKSKEDMQRDQQESAASESLVSFGSQFKGHAVQQTMNRVRKQLPAHQRAFSKVIHQPVVESVSDVAGQTVARPSGLLVGGFFSVISSLVVLYICRHYGYEYNYLVGIICFTGGFALGLLIEGAFKLVKR